MKALDIKNGSAVQITFGMGRSVLGQISDKVTNKWGTHYEVTTEDGEIETVHGFVTGNEIGCKIL